jgi:hypothetical protein
MTIKTAIVIAIHLTILRTILVMMLDVLPVALWCSDKHPRQESRSIVDALAAGSATQIPFPERQVLDYFENSLCPSLLDGVRS